MSSITLDSGTYISTPDVNLLDADSAHHYQSIGTYVLVQQAGTASLETEATATYGKALQFLASSPAGSVQVAIGWGGLGLGPVISASTEYALRIRARTLAGADRTAQAAWSGWNGSSFVNQITGSTATLPASGAWVNLDAVGVSGAATDNALPFINITDAADTDPFQIDIVCFRLGADPTFFPSLNVVGTLAETKSPSDLADAYSGGFLTVGDGWAGDAVSYTLYDGAAGVGPIVAKMDANDAVTVGDTDTWVGSADGRTWTVNGSGAVLNPGDESSSGRLLVLGLL